MNRDARRSLRFPPGSRSEPLYFETGDYTVPDALDARFPTPDELFIDTDFEDGESTTITRHRWR